MLKRLLNKLLIFLSVQISRCSRKKGIVYMMHSVGMDCPPEECLNIDMDKFFCFIEKLKAGNIIHIEDWVSNSDFTVLTFDDVWESVYQNAYPVLCEQEIPFTLFVSVELLDKPNYISTNQLREMAKNPLCTIGSHGVHHTFYSKLNKKQLEEEFKVSKERLESLIGKDVNVFAFPYGSYYAVGLRRKTMALKYYRYAFSTIPAAITTCSMHNYFLPRINCY